MTFLGWLSDPYHDLQLGDRKVTLHHLVASVLDKTPDSFVDNLNKEKLKSCKCTTKRTVFSSTCFL